MCNGAPRVAPDCGGMKVSQSSTFTEPPQQVKQSLCRRGLPMDYRTACEAVVNDPRFLANLDWGESRQGHPEGTVRAHIAEIEPNLELLRPSLTDEDYW